MSGGLWVLIPALLLTSSATLNNVFGFRCFIFKVGMTTVFQRVAMRMREEKACKLCHSAWWIASAQSVLADDDDGDDDDDNSKGNILEPQLPPLSEGMTIVLTL